MNLKSNNKQDLNEGLFQGDLVNLIEPVVSIDEYKSKILDDDESIVVVFKIENRDAAFDLSSFIERGPFAVLDTEVSDKLDADGSYALFLEMVREERFVKNFLFMLNKINRVAALKMSDWQFEAYKMAGKRPLNSKELKANIRLQQMDELPDESLLEQSDDIILRRINY